MKETVAHKAARAGDTRNMLQYPEGVTPEGYAVMVYIDDNFLRVRGEGAWFESEYHAAFHVLEQMGMTPDGR